MTESAKDLGSVLLAQASKLVSPSNYWGTGNFGSLQEITLPELPVEILSADLAEILLPTPLESKPS